MSRAVLDASALLTLLFQEPGGEKVIDRLPGSMLSAVNLSEVVTKSVDTGMPLEEARLVMAGLPCQIVPFDREQAYLTGSLATGDPAFRSLPRRPGVPGVGPKTGWPVVTAERMWAECDVGVQVIRIR